MFSRLAIRRRVTTMMVTMMVFLAGIVSYMNLDMDLMPEIDIPIVVVSTTYVGAGPEEIENLVTKPLEESLTTSKPPTTPDGFASLPHFAAQTKKGGLS